MKDTNEYKPDVVSHPVESLKEMFKELNVSFEEDFWTRLINNYIEYKSKDFVLSLELLRWLHDLQNGCPLPKYEKDWDRTMKESGELLEKYDM